MSGNNIAYIDGQNLYIGTMSADIPWQVDYVRFYKFLERKHNVAEDYYFIGDRQERQAKLYQNLQRAGFTLVFRMHNEEMISCKKGNVDTDIVFSVMRDLYEGRFNNGKVVIVSSDGDYARMVSYLARINKLQKIIFPNYKNSSFLYTTLDNKYKIHLDDPTIKSLVRHSDH